MAAHEKPRMLAAEDFEPFVGREVRFDDTGIVLVLDQVERFGDAASDGSARAPFLLIFRGPKNSTALPEGLYACDFGADVFSIHVAPIHTPTADWQDYQAVFA